MINQSKMKIILGNQFSFTKDNLKIAVLTNDSTFSFLFFSTEES